ncbi:MAG: hypothetical protein ABEJ99_02950 [Candidatus Nanohaloarchaea archaeon]
MKEEEVIKNILDLKYQHNLSLSNVLIGASLTLPPALFSAWVAFTGSFSVPAALAIGESSSIIFAYGVLKRRQANKYIQQIWDLAE